MLFNVYTGKEIKQVSGRKIRLDVFGEFFIDHRRYKPCDGGIQLLYGDDEPLCNDRVYMVTEPLSGAWVDYGFTVREAIGNTWDSLDEKGLDYFVEQISKAVAEIGHPLN